MEEKRLYLVSHVYDTDGGFGDAIYQIDPLFSVYATPEEIEKFQKEWDKPYVYDKPYADLYCHGINIQEIVPIDDISNIDTDWLEDELNFKR